MRTNLESELMAKSLKLWGIQSQLLMLAEEASELSVAALHMNRINKDQEQVWRNFVEEIADVEFMISEMKYCFPGLEGDVIGSRNVKARRLDAMILQAELASKSGK